MKKISIIFSLLISCFLSAENFVSLTWNEPQISSLYQPYILQKNLNENELINLSPKDDYLAISSPKSLVQAFRNCISKTDNSSFYSKNIQSAQTSSHLNLRFYAGADYTRNLTTEKHYYYYNYAVLFTGNIKSKLFYYANWYMGKFGLDSDVAQKTSPLFDTWKQQSTNDDGFYLDNMTAKISYHSNVGDFTIGRGKYEIGSNISGSVILNDVANDYGYFSHNLQLGKFSLSFMHATLVADSTNAEIGNNALYYKNYEDKYLVVHKLDWNPNPKFHFFVGEHIIYGSRNIDPSYLLPHTFMRVTEHNLYDRDNVLIFWGGDWQISSSNTIYSNLILDELSKSKIFTNWWGNKYAFQIGNSQKLFFRDSKITVEFTAVRPWMYTHKYLVNKFSNEKKPLGFTAGSNILQYTVELNLDLANSLKLDLQSSYSRQGSVGNDFLVNYKNRPTDEASWLEGDITDKYRNGVILTWQVNHHHLFKIGYEIEQIRSEDANDTISISYQAIY